MSQKQARWLCGNVSGLQKEVEDLKLEVENLKQYNKDLMEILIQSANVQKKTIQRLNMLDKSIIFINGQISRIIDIILEKLN
jgi:hypothetical protein